MVFETIFYFMTVRVLFDSIQNDDLEIAVDRKNCHKGDLQRS